MGVFGWIGGAATSVVETATKAVGPIVGGAWNAWAEAAGSVANVFAPGSKKYATAYLKGVGDTLEHAGEFAINVVNPDEDIDLSRIAEEEGWGISKAVGGVYRELLNSGAATAAAKEWHGSGDISGSLKGAAGLASGAVVRTAFGNVPASPTTGVNGPAAFGSPGASKTPLLLVGALLLKKLKG